MSYRSRDSTLVKGAAAMSARRYFAHVCAGILILLLIVAVITVGGCSEDSPVSEQSGNGGQDPPPPPPSPPDSVIMSIRIVSWDDLTGQFPVGATPGDVNQIQFEISAPDIQTQTRTVQAGQAPIGTDFMLDPGAARRIFIQAFDDTPSVIYSGTKYVDIVDSVLVTGVGMVSTSDDTPPVFTGLDDAVAVSDTYVMLSWQPATDGGTPDNKAVYLVYVSTTDGSFDYSSPSYTTETGETSLVITNLDPGTTYYFVVRAMDRAGNISLNTSQLSVATPPASGALYVDVINGTDNSACGTSSSPCKTITYALSKSAVDQTIHVAEGTYNTASGELFPLRLKPGTTLIGDGFWWMGVKVIKRTIIEGPTPVILGSDNASIMVCYVKPTDWGTSSVAIDDDGHPITVFRCTIDGVLYSGAIGVGFSAGSSLIETRIENLSGGGGRAVVVWGAGGALIKGNKVINNASGISVQASHTTVSHCIVENIACGGITVAAIDMVVSDVVIFHNYIYNCGCHGVGLNNTDDAEVVFNSISESSSNGIAVNSQQDTHLVKIKNNSISEGSSSAIWLTSGQAEIIGNAIVCNIAGVYLSTNQVIDLRWNEWDHDPPTISPGRGFYDPGCDGFFDICYQRDYAGTPEPIYQPHSGKGSCLIGVVPKPSSSPPAR
jgi:hypothetical protein